VTSDSVMSLVMTSCMMAENPHVQDRLLLLGIICDGLRVLS
jgi:hypothetical protein